jgi:hypothetical protein
LGGDFPLSSAVKRRVDCAIPFCAIDLVELGDGGSRTSADQDEIIKIFAQLQSRAELAVSVRAPPAEDAANYRITRCPHFGPEWRGTGVRRRLPER